MVTTSEMKASLQKLQRWHDQLIGIGLMLPNVEALIRLMDDDVLGARQREIEALEQRERTAVAAIAQAEAAMAPLQARLNELKALKRSFEEWAQERNLMKTT